MRDILIATSTVVTLKNLTAISHKGLYISCPSLMFKARLVLDCQNVAPKRCNINQRCKKFYNAGPISKNFYGCSL
jgi:hypothetical protein